MNSTKLHTTVAVLFLLLILNQGAWCHRLSLLSLYKRQSVTSPKSRPNKAYGPLLDALTDSPSSRHTPPSDMESLDLDSPCGDSDSDVSCVERPNLDRTIMDILFGKESRNLREGLIRKGSASDKPSAQKRRGHQRSSFYSNW